MDVAAQLTRQDVASFGSQRVGIMVMFNVGTLSREFCRKTFVFHVLAKDKTTNYGTDAFCVRLRSGMQRL
jgi:hypothetical protein